MGVDTAGDEEDNLLLMRGIPAKLIFMLAAAATLVPAIPPEAAASGAYPYGPGDTVIGTPRTHTIKKRD
ncbi:MAG: hypothetical protein M0Z75_12605, partial [Nitrospiraceae bacterium]|nr:hypothetical protein [Nitrospiraceae bacterium]